MVWAAKNIVIPPAKNLPKESEVFIEISKPLQIMMTKATIRMAEPINPNSSAIIAKIESVVLSGS